MTVEKTVAIPDGGTVVFGGMKKLVETRQEYGPPVLSRIPYVSRLFKNVGCGREAQSVFVAITPRIIVDEEQERAPSTKPRLVAVKAEETEAKLVAGLVKAYEAACAEGRPEEAEKLARAA